MNIVTLTSDLGIKDYYLASVKAAALTQISDLHWVDISHHIPPFNIAKAAFVLKNVWKDFPEGTCHIVGVDCEWRKDTPYVIVKKDNRYFLGSDNGIFSLIFDSEPADEVIAIQLQGDEDLSFPVKSILIPAVAALCAGKKPGEMGTAINDYKHRATLNPVIEYNNIRGTVIYVDEYGNVITNITKELFEKEVGDKPFHIVSRRGDSELNTISRAYNEVPEGEKLALFTGAGYLEIAINKGVEGSGGGASDLLGIKENDIIRIEIEE